MSRRLLAVLLCLHAAPLLAKELYLTVRRDFGPSETPVIELNYSRSAPFTIRIYRPKDMKEFITSQVDLRRAWRQPKVELNSARYLFSGLNHTRLELDWLRVAANAEMRGKLKDEYGGASWSRTGTRLVEGPLMLIAGPDKFDLVTEFAFSPDDEDAKLPFDVPGFDWWFSREGRLRQKNAELPKLGPGFYLVQVIQGDLEGQVVLVVNDLSGELQQSSDAALVRVTRRDGHPAAGAEVEVRNLQGAWVAKGRTDKNGVLELAGIKDSELLAVVREKDSTAIIDTEFFPTLAVFPDVYLYTDRPLYRHGNKVRFKGILRSSSGGVSRLWASLTGQPESARVSIVDLAGASVVAEVEAPLSAFGTFAGELDLGAADLNGVYRVRARVAAADHIGEFRVKEYVKPLFFLKLDTAQETLKAGGRLTGTVSVERYAGGVPEGVKYSAQLFRVRADTPQWVEDAGLGETGSATTYFWDLPRGDTVSVPYPVASSDNLEFDADGKSALTLDLPQQLPGPPNYDYKFLLKLFAQDPDGNTAGFSKSFPDMRSEVVALARMSVVVAGPDHAARLAVRAVYPSGKPYGRTKGTLAWTLTPYKAAAISHEVTFVTGDDGRWDAPVPTDRAGRLTATVTLLDRFAKPTTSEATIVVFGRKAGEPLVDVPEITFFQERDSFAPGEVARVLVLLPDGWGEGGRNEGRLYLTVAGRQIYEQRVLPVTGLSTWISEPIVAGFGTAAYGVVAYPDANRGWIERTLTFRIPPRDKALAVGITPGASSVRPGAEQSLTLKVLGADGKPVRAEVSVAVVDKAVLALQPEFRPSLLAFFYPIDRLNLMSFFSREFQSYGYGERLAGRFGPNFWLSATKPLKESKEDDTAYWNPRVLTDANGTATVSFQLPGNQTTWNVSAVAVDTQGRFGEGGAEFGTNAPVTFALGAPSFLRQGDATELRLLVTNQEKKVQDVSASIALPPGLTAAQPVVFTHRLEAKQEASGRGTITVAGDAPIGFVTLATTLTLPDQALRFEHPLRTLPGSVSHEEHRLLRHGQAVDTTTKPGEKLTAVHVFATSGVASALLPALRWMMTYPYGCAEQVTSTTVPSLLVRDLFGEPTPPVGAGQAQPSEALFERFKRLFLGQPSPPPVAGGAVPAAREAEMLANAADFSRAGLAKLKSMQNQDGSLTWWPGGGAGDPTMTAVVLAVLAALDDPQPIQTLDARRAVGWLKEHTPRLDSPLGITISYVESRLSALKLAPEGGGSLEATLRFQGEWASKQGTVLDKSLLLLALASFHFDSKPGLDTLASSLRADLLAAVAEAVGTAGFRNPERWTPELGEWPEYPGRLPSTLAVAGHALHEVGAVDRGTQARLAKRLVESFDGEEFGSTFETSQVLVHSEWLMRDELKAAASEPRLRVMVAGREVPEGRIERRPTLGGVDLLVDPIEASHGPLSIEGGEDLTVQVGLTTEVPLDRVAPVAGGWELRKELYRLDEHTGELTPLEGPVRIGELV
ncbi:MAG: alpha-2-macroglobulin family protein [Thermoanaerobaculales bacterium]